MRLSPVSLRVVLLAGQGSLLHASSLGTHRSPLPRPPSKPFSGASVSYLIDPVSFSRLGFSFSSAFYAVYETNTCRIPALGSSRAPPAVYYPLYNPCDLWVCRYAPTSLGLLGLSVFSGSPSSPGSPDFCSGSNGSGAFSALARADYEPNPFGFCFFLFFSFLGKPSLFFSAELSLGSFLSTGTTWPISLLPSIVFFPFLKGLSPFLFSFRRLHPPGPPRKSQAKQRHSLLTGPGLGLGDL